uniref:Type 4 pilus biogenesis n=2 Tax=Aromatoleum buckelii TaxID=200254 RepID=A0ABX1MXU5_9RHOO
MPAPCTCRLFKMAARFDTRCNASLPQCGADEPTMNRTAHLAVSFSVVLSVTALAASSGTAAVALGEAVAVSAIGAPLRVEIAIAGGEPARTGECLKLTPGTSEGGVPWVRDARIGVVGQGRAARIVVSGTAPLGEPVVQLGIEDTCGAHLRREYTLLLSFPDFPPEAPAVADEIGPELQTPPAPPEPSAFRTKPRTVPGGGTSSVQAARSARKTPRTPAPAFASAAEREPALRDEGHPSPSGTEVRRQDGLRLSSAALKTEPPRTATDGGPDQLQREQSAIAAIDRTIVAQLELNERIRRLEQIQAAMMERLRATAGPISPTSTIAPSATAPSAITPASFTPASSWRDWIVPATVLATLFLVLAARGLWLRRHRADAATRSAAAGLASLPSLPALPGRLDAPCATRGTPAAPASSAGPGFPLSAATSVQARPPVSRPEYPRTKLPAAALLVEDEAEEHESAIELAEIMMAFGRVQGAAETLAEFIQSNPKKAVTPWLKLLEVYRAAGLRPEFDTLARQLNKTFNVKAVTWDTFDEARRPTNTIEQMPHVMSRIQVLWGSRDCQAYLENLVRDNRDGLREGFPLSVIDEILVLAGVLEEGLGPYQPDVRKELSLSS